MTRFLEAEGTILTEQLSEALSADNFYAASLEKQSSALEHTFGEREVVCGVEEELGPHGWGEGLLQQLEEAVEHELDDHGREAGLLQRLGEVGMRDSAPLFHQESLHLVA